METLDLSLIIIGKICSGKSTLASDFSKWLNFPKASFGGYLADYSKKHGLPIKRDALQDLGTSFIKANHSLFLNEVMIFSSPTTKNFIFEGVRHKVVFDEIKDISKKSFAIFLDAKEDVRLERFIKREKEIDKSENAKEDFYTLSSHPVEQEVDQLKDLCNFVISTNESYQEFLSVLSLYR